MIKKVTALFLYLFIICSCPVLAEEKPITIVINEEQLSTPVAPALLNDRTMLPMRAIFEALGAKVNWAEGDELIFATRGDSLLVLKIGTAAMSVQKIGSHKNVIVPLDAAPYLQPEGHTMVPARAIAEELDAKVDWDALTRTVIITQNTTE